MLPLIANIDFGLVFGLGIPVGAGFLIAITALLTSHHRQLQRDDMEATLKMEMIQRGMPADEIERVLAARMGQPSQAARGRMGRDYRHYWQQYEEPQPAQR